MCKSRYIMETTKFHKSKKNYVRIIILCVIKDGRSAWNGSSVPSLDGDNDPLVSVLKHLKKKARASSSNTPKFQLQWL